MPDRCQQAATIIKDGSFTAPGCLYFRAVDPARYAVAGYCGARREQGLLMIPSLEEHGRFCTTCDFHACPHFSAANLGLSRAR